MKVVVDATEVREVDSTEALGLAYRELVGELFEDGRTVVRVSLDAKELSQDELTKLLDGEELGGDALELETVGTLDLTRDTLRQVAGHFDPLRRGLETAVTHLGRDERTQALEAFRPTLQVWLAICETVQKVCVLSGIDVAAGAPEVSLEAAHRRVVKVLGGIQSSFERQDWVKLADQLAHELLPVVDEWESLVRTLLQKLEHDQSA